MQLSGAGIDGRHKSWSARCLPRAFCHEIGLAFLNCVMAKQSENLGRIMQRPAARELRELAILGRERSAAEEATSIARSNRGGHLARKSIRGFSVQRGELSDHAIESAGERKVLAQTKYIRMTPARSHRIPPLAR
jgi:hypothetical protein